MTPFDTYREPLSTLRDLLPRLVELLEIEDAVSGAAWKNLDARLLPLVDPRLPLMVAETDQRHATNFTISIEAVEGITTGISAHDRARTVRAAVAKDAKPEDLSQPGHIFPLKPKREGVLRRTGHTEATIDLARLAGRQHLTMRVDDLDDDVLGAQVHPPLRTLMGDEAGVPTAVAIGHRATEHRLNRLPLVVIDPLRASNLPRSRWVCNPMARAL